jgi:hypothetical protein
MTEATAYTRDDLVAGLHTRGVCYLTPTPHGDELALGDDALIAGIARAEDARLRFALAGLFLVHPHLAELAAVIDTTLEGSVQAELRKQYAAAMYLQRLWRTHLRMQFGETPLIPERFTAELDLPSSDLMHGEYGLRTLCDRSPYNDWSSYQQVIDLLSTQPCARDRVLAVMPNRHET